MDSLTQFTLGATIGVALLGRRLGLRRAAVTGGVLGTLPDLDVYLPAVDPVADFVGHRGVTHSLLVHAVAAPLLGEGLRRLFADLRPARPLAYLAVFLCLITHALLDAMTIYGTQLFWPLWREPLGLGSVFIIDPLYTLPLFTVTLWALIQKRWSAAFGRGLTAALLLSSGYLAWSAAAQAWAERRGADLLATQNLDFQRLIATPTPFNTLYWRVIAVDRLRYYHVYLPMLGDREAMRVYAHARWPAELCGSGLDGNGLAKALAAFTDGFYAVSAEGDALVVSDLRMGLPPDYVFRFAVAERDGQGARQIAPRRIRGDRRAPGDIDWLTAGIFGRALPRPMEESVALAPAGARVAALGPVPGPAC